MKKSVKEHVKTVIVCAILAAVGFVLDRFLGITVPLFGVKSLSVNISFVPIFLAGFLYGPVWGALVGGVQDILCVIFVPLGPFMPGITLSTMLAGAMAGFFKMIFMRDGQIKESAPQGEEKTVGGKILSVSLCVLTAAFAALLFVPSVSAELPDGSTASVSVWQTLVETEEYKTLFTSVLRALDTGDSAGLVYTGIAVSDTASGIALGFTSALVFGIVSLAMYFGKRRLPAFISAFACFVLSGLSSFTVILQIPKKLDKTGISVTVGAVPYILAAISCVLLLAMILNRSAALTKLAVFCFVASTVTSVLNSFWISLTYTSVSFWVYLVPRLAAALFIGVPLYTAILWFLLKKAVPSLKKSRLL
ncbi:MAG: ECF transporter S component [Clostridia bacterium]|nr:ECF transporter S component [Clostridia bacterium]